MTHALRIRLAVALGSALGGASRWLVTVALQGPPAAGHFPWGTLCVNLVGSFLIVFYATLAAPEGRLLASPARRQFVMAGFCGGFTTFSVFSLETLVLVEGGHGPMALAYVVCSVVSWFLGASAGHMLGLRLDRPEGSMR